MQQPERIGLKDIKKRQQKRETVVVADVNGVIENQNPGTVFLVKKREGG